MGRVAPGAGQRGQKSAGFVLRLIYGNRLTTACQGNLLTQAATRYHMKVLGSGAAKIRMMTF
jgi:hypothetical protein